MVEQVEGLRYVTRFSFPAFVTRFSEGLFVTIFSGLLGLSLQVFLAALSKRCAPSSLSKRIRAVEGATRIRLRLVSAEGPLRTGPLLLSLIAGFTMISFCFLPHNLEIGNCAREGTVCMHLPPANAGQAESVGGETVDDEGEFCMHEKGSDMEDKEGKRTTPCAVPIPIMAL